LIIVGRVGGRWLRRDRTAVCGEYWRLYERRGLAFPRRKA